MIPEGDVLNEKTKNQPSWEFHWCYTLILGAKIGPVGHPCVPARFPGASVIPAPDCIIGAAKLAIVAGWMGGWVDG